MFDNNRVIDESNETYNHVKLFNIVRKKVRTRCIDVNAAGSGEYSMNVVCCSVSEKCTFQCEQNLPRLEQFTGGNSVAV